MNTKLFVFLIVCFGFAGCSKEGPGGQAALIAEVIEHSAPVPGAIVYIKYGTREFPGTDVSVYDDSRITATSGDTVGRAEFRNLHKGYYYLYAVSIDTAAHEGTGGVPVELERRDILRKQISISH